MPVPEPRTLDAVLRDKDYEPNKPAICPHCGTLSSRVSIVSTGLEHVVLPDGASGRQFQLGRCLACHGLHLAVAAWNSSGLPEEGMRLVWPAHTPPDRAPANLDPEIRAVYNEARLVLPLSPRSSAVLARRVVQHVIRTELEIQKSTLFAEIEEAIKSPRLTKPVRDALDHVRKIGNRGAHPENKRGASQEGSEAVGTEADNDEAKTLMDVSPEDAAYTLGVVELLFNDLYAVPARISLMTQSLAARSG